MIPKKASKKWLCRLLLTILPSGLWLVMLSGVPSAKSLPATNPRTGSPQIYAAQGVVLSVNRDKQQIIIRHDAISNYMAAMTMPFTVKNPDDLAGVQRGDVITFKLHVTATASWVEHLVKTGIVILPTVASAGIAPAADSLRDYHFTNELGQPVSLNDFRGQALAITFIYTRCPLPDYCPRLSKNFQAAAQQLTSAPDAPTNWHFLSFSFDPEFDTPPRLKAYGESYQYDPKRWSFLTGPAEKISELARQAGVSYEPDAGTFNHNFRTLILDASGQLQMVFPTSGDLSDQIVSEIRRAADATNQPALQKSARENGFPVKSL